MTDWLTVRVVLVGRADEPLDAQAGRVLLVRADHTFAELAEAVDVAFGRWDLTPSHVFSVGRRRLWSDATIASGAPAELSGDVQLGEALGDGSTFSYLFDLGERWEHACDVEGLDEDPVEAYGAEPELPVPVFGWGSLPDQYGRDREDEEEEAVPEDDPWDDEDGWEADDDAAYLAAWERARADAWEVVATAVARIDRRVDHAELATVARALRHHAGDHRPPYDLLWAAADLDLLPDDDALLWTTLAAATIEPRGELPLAVDAEAAWTALEPADWAGAVIELTRAGPGERAEPGDLVALLARCPEIEGAPFTPEDVDTLELALEPVVALWRVLGMLDDEHRLTALGHWGLPEALRAAWTAA
jgi:hypothetical protein